MTDWQEIIEFMHDPETQEAVARQSEPQEDEEPQPEQMAMEGI